MTSRARLLCTTVFTIGALATGCSAGNSTENGSGNDGPADAVRSVDAADTDATVATTLSARSLGDLLAEDEFVPLGVALERSGLDAVIEELDRFVLFAPTAAAFSSSGPDVGIEFPTLMNDPTLLDAVMRYHLVADPASNLGWRTLNGASVDVDGAAVDAIERVDGVDVLDEIEVRNGTVVVISQLLVPAMAP